jgi:hypothetical protein
VVARRIRPTRAGGSAGRPADLGALSKGQVGITVTGPDDATVALTMTDLRGLSADSVREVLDEMTRKLMPPRQDSPDDQSASEATAESAGATGGRVSGPAPAGRKAGPAS